MPTQSDTGTREFRAWWRKHMMGSPVFGEPQEPLTWLTHEEQVWNYLHTPPSPHLIFILTLIFRYNNLITLSLHLTHPWLQCNSWIDMSLMPSPASHVQVH